MRTVTLTGRYTSPDGDPARIKLKFSPSSTLKNSAENVVVLNEPVYALTNGAGNFTVDLYPQQTNLVPSGFLYWVEEYDGNTVLQGWWIKLDATTPDTVSLPTLYPSAPPPPNVAIYPTIEDVRTIASNLDASLYAAIAAQNSKIASNAALLANKIDTADIGIKVPSLVNGVIPVAQVPAIRFENTFVVNSQAAMLALSTATIGDLCVRTDNSTCYVLGANNPSQLSSWVLLSNNFAVTSVNGKTGVVVLGPSDVGAAPYDHQHSVLSGFNYVATYLRGSDVNVMNQLLVADGGDQVVVDTRTVKWVDAAGQTIYSINPHDPQPWSPFAITPLDASANPITSGITKSSEVRHLSADVYQVNISLSGWLSGNVIRIDDAQAQSGLYTGVFGQWVMYNNTGAPLTAGSAVVDSLRRVTLLGLLPYLSANPGVSRSSITITVAGEFQSAYVGITDLLPVPNNQYRLQVGTVDTGTMDAEITGAWPVQTLNLTLPTGNMLVLHTGDPLPAGTPSGTVVIRYTAGTGERAATVTVVG